MAPGSLCSVYRIATRTRSIWKRVVSILEEGWKRSISKRAESRFRVRNQKNWLYLWESGFHIWLLTLSLSICVMLGELPNLAGPSFLPL